MTRENQGIDFPFFRRRFHGVSPVTDAIATTMLEDEEWHTEFLTESARMLRKNHKLVAEAFDNADIPYGHDA